MKKEIKTFFDTEKKCPWCIKNGIKIVRTSKAILFSCYPQQGKRCAYTAWIPKTQLTMTEHIRYYGSSVTKGKYECFKKPLNKKDVVDEDFLQQLKSIQAKKLANSGLVPLASKTTNGFVKPSDSCIMET